MDPFNYQGLGIDWFVERILDEQTETRIKCLQRMVKRTTGRDWDGKEPLWTFLIEQLRQDALMARVHRQFGEINAKVGKTYLYIQAYEQMTNMDHEHESAASKEYEKARQYLIGFIKESANITDNGDK